MGTAAALPKKELWEASPTPISRWVTTYCGPQLGIGERDPSYDELVGKAVPQLELSFLISSCCILISTYVLDRAKKKSRK